MDSHRPPLPAPSPMPCHIGIIMDGNGRWAQRRGLPRTAGHQAGTQTARRVVEACVEMGIGALTLYAFSTENWGRLEQEVSFLMRLLKRYLNEEVETLNEHNVRLRVLGRREGLPSSLAEGIERAIRLTEGNTGLNLNIALNYGGRSELVDAARSIIRGAQRGELNPDTLDAATFDRYLYTAGLPDLELIIRTSGEMRLSNFLIWQAVDAYFWVTPTLWPDFERGHLLSAISAWRDNERCKEAQ